MRMLQETYEDDGTNHGYLEEDVDIDYLVDPQISTTLEAKLIVMEARAM